MRTIDEGEIDQPIGAVRWKDSPWDVLDQMDELLKPFGLEMFQATCCRQGSGRISNIKAG